MGEGRKFCTRALTMPVCQHEVHVVGRHDEVARRCAVQVQELAVALHRAVDEPRLPVVRQARLRIIEEGIRLAQVKVAGKWRCINRRWRSTARSINHDSR